MGGAWLIIRPCSGAEAKAVRSLTEAGFEAYCPMKTVWNRLSREKDAKREMALFPGYLFVREDEHYDRLYQMVFDRALWGVSGFHWIKGEFEKQHMRAPAAFVGELQARQDAMEFDNTAPRPKWRPKKGERVQIHQGPFAGFMAEVMEAKGEKRVRLLLDMFGKRQVMAVKVEQVRAA